MYFRITIRQLIRTCWEFQNCIDNLTEEESPFSFIFCLTIVTHRFARNTINLQELKIQKNETTIDPDDRLCAAVMRE